jgi:hypothetical protein
MATIRVRSYQGLAVYHSLVILGAPAPRPARGLVLDYAVGSGKSLICLIVSAILLASNQVRKTIHAVPGNDIKLNFVEHSGDLILPAQGASLVGTVPSIIIPETRSGDTGRELMDFIQDPCPGAIVITYQMLRLHYEEIVAAFGGDLSGLFLTLDEGHRIGSTRTAQEILETTRVVMDARARGTRTMQLSGTAYRGDGLDIVLTDDAGNLDPVIQRTLFQHNSEGYTPNLEAQVLPLQVGGYDVGDQVAIPLPEYAEVTAQGVLEHMRADGFPISFVRVKACRNSADNQAMLEVIRSTLEDGSNGAIRAITHAQSSSAVENAIYDRFVTAVKRKAPYDEIRSIANVVVVLQMFDEGVDIGAISHSYIWGIPESMGTVQQIIGRILRPRIDHDTRRPLYAGYPPSWLNQSKVVLVTSALDDSARRDLFMFRIAAWFYSYALGSFLRRNNNLVEWVRTVPTQDPARDAEMARRSALTVWAAELACRAVVFLAANPPANGDDPVEPLVNQALGNPDVQIPEGSSETEARSVLRRAIGRLIRITQPRIHVPDQEEYNDLEEQAILEATAQFVDIAQGQSVLDYVFRVRAQDPCCNLHRDVCLETSLDQALRFAAEFQAAEDRLPGSRGRPLNGERVPSRMNYFDRLSGVAWRETLVTQTLATTPRRDQVQQQRRAWSRSGINHRQTHTDYTHSVAVRNDPLVVYFPSVLWVYPYEWTDALTLGDLATLGSWMAMATKARVLSAVDAVNQQTNQFVQANSTDALVEHIRAGTLDQIRAATAAAE